MTISNLVIQEDKLNFLCKKFFIKELSIFGSSLREDFNSNSDIDLLVTFEDSTNYSLFDIVKIKEEFEKFFNKPVDLISKKAVEKSTNMYRKKNILGSAKVIYAS
jgi:predicted nucleotidyltransferase